MLLLHVPQANKKYTPQDLRVKKTRAIRRRLTKAQTSATLVKQQKRAAAYPARKFAVRA
jgi:large subunit ribosomal protein L35e